MDRIVIALFLLFCTTSLVAQNVDPNYGTQGVTTTPLNATGDMWGVSALQSDGKMVAAGFVTGTGELAVTRYLTNGQLDPAFSGDGKVTAPTNFSTTAVPKLAITVLTNGKILVMISDYNNRFYLFRLTSSGVLDPTFLTNGFTYFDYNSFPGTLIRYIYGLTVQPDGKILLAGRGKMTTTTDGFLVARIQANGYTLDNTFSGDGVLVFDPYQYGSEAKDILLQTDGSMVVGGNVQVSSQPGYSYGLAKLSSTGANAYFPGSANNVAAYTAGQFAKFVQQPDGKIVIMGDYASGVNIRLLRVLPSSALDYSFGTLGYAGINWIIGANDLNAGKGISLLANGSFLVAGTLYRSTGNVAKMARLNPDGSPDLTFGTQGTVSGIFGNGAVQCNSLQVLPDGTAILTGSKKNGNQYDLALTRWYLKCTKFKTINQTLCGGQVFYYNNQSFTQTGTYTLTVSGPSCDSAITLNIAAFPDVVPEASITCTPAMPVCTGSPVTFQSSIQHGGTNPTYAWKKNFTTTVATTPTYTSTTLVVGDQISLTLTSNHPCAATPWAGSNTIDITTSPTPVASISQNGTQLSCPATTGAQYQWLDCNNSNAPIAGAIFRNYAPGQSGSFAIRVTKGTCVATSPCFSFIFTSVAAPGQKPEELVFFPNPTGDQLTIAFTAPQQTGFQIRDALGRSLRFGLLDTRTTEISLQGLPGGVYSLWVQGKGMYRFVKE